MATYKRLSVAEREVIHQELAIGKGCNAIAKRLRRHKSTVSRELRCLGGLSEEYSPFLAHTRSKQQQSSRKTDKKKIRNSLSLLIEELLLKYHFSPEQISHHIKKQFPSNHSMHVSHETIYKYIYHHKDVSKKHQLIGCLRRRKKHRRRRRKAPEKRGGILNMKTIHERPAAANQRAEPGHWEGDLIVGKNHKSAVLTLVERHSRFVCIVKLENNLTSEETIKACESTLIKFPPALRKSLTYDRGKEMALHARLTTTLGMDVYFADPHAPWQRGSNENTNGLIREFFPKGTDFSKHSAEEIKKVESLLNMRPRKVLLFETPEATMLSHLRATSCL